MWHTHTTEYSSDLKRNEVLTQATTWKNLEIMFGGRSQTQQAPCCRIPIIGNIPNGQMHRPRKQICSCQGLGEGGTGVSPEQVWVVHLRWWKILEGNDSDGCIALQILFTRLVHTSPAPAPPFPKAAPSTCQPQALPLPPFRPGRSLATARETRDGLYLHLRTPHHIPHLDIQVSYVVNIVVIITC